MAFQKAIQQLKQHLKLPANTVLSANESLMLALYTFPEAPALILPQDLLTRLKSKHQAIQSELCALNAQWQLALRANAGRLDSSELVQTCSEQLSHLLQAPVVLKEVSWFRYLPEGSNLPELNLPQGWLCRRLDEKDAASVAHFKSQCPAADQAMGQVSLDDPLAFACFNAQSEIVGMASYWFWADHLADIGILTSPAARGKGVAAAVAMALTDWGQKHGKLSQFRHLDSNFASARVADKLGFEKAFVALFFALAVHPD